MNSARKPINMNGSSSKPKEPEAADPGHPLRRAAGGKAPARRNSSIWCRPKITFVMMPIVGVWIGLSITTFTHHLYVVEDSIRTTIFTGQDERPGKSHRRSPPNLAHGTHYHGLPSIQKPLRTNKGGGDAVQPEVESGPLNKVNRTSMAEKRKSPAWAKNLKEKVNLRQAAERHEAPPITWKAPPSTQTVKNESAHEGNTVHSPPLKTGGSHVARNHSTASDYHPPFGFVMRDFARRVLSRDMLTESNVLVIAPDAKEALEASAGQSKHDGINPYDSVDFVSPYSLAGTFAMHANIEGHQTHAMNTGAVQKDGTRAALDQSLDDWWASFDDERQRPGWIILAVVDPGLDFADTVWHDSEKFLQESTITYMVTAVRSRVLRNGKIQMYGLEGAKALLKHRYKVQVLQVSHYHVETGNEENIGNNALLKNTTNVIKILRSDEYESSRFDANALLKNVEDVKSFLRWGAKSAVMYSNTTAPLFTAYLFGTQGLDLAIPSRREYIGEDSASRVTNWESKGQLNLYRRMAFNRCPKATNDRNIFLKFAKKREGTSLNITLRSPADQQVVMMKPSLEGWNAPSTNQSVLSPDSWHMRKQYKWFDKATLNVWYNAETLTKSEAACVQYKDMVECATRMLSKQKEMAADEKRVRERKGQELEGADLLVIMLDPISRGHFQHSMPETRRLLQRLNFTHFGNYSVVGDNSGPNQAALYSGLPRSDRNGISKTNGGSEWLWDRLRREGYVTLKGEDGCIENSNMLQSLKPNTTHGEALNQMFCFDFDRPNCLGRTATAAHLMSYARKFIDTYGTEESADESLPWAAFLHFVDTHEDTMTLSSYLDPLLADFLNRLHQKGKLSNAVVVVMSDHGLHYGPYFQSLPGRRERAEPLLYMGLPSRLEKSRYRQALESNAEMWTTPFDVYHTMLNVTVGMSRKESAEATRQNGLSLLDPLPLGRRTCAGVGVIPQRFCDLHDTFHSMQKNDTMNKCYRTPRPPSMLSFFADIPRSHRPSYDPKCSEVPQQPPKKLPDMFQFFTNYRPWLSGKEHPWGPDGLNSTQHPWEHFAAVLVNSTDKESVWFYTRFARKEDLVLRYVKARNRTTIGSLSSFNGKSENTSQTMSNVAEAGRQSLEATKESTQRSKDWRPPDVLFLEIDSVSIPHADRHLPLTRRFLKEYRAESGQNGKVACKDGICTVDFSKFAIVGPNSVANQVAALSGCVVSRFHESCFNASLPTDKCLEEGLSGHPQGCNKCFKGSFPKDPLVPCNTSKHTPQNCCTKQYPEWNSTRICNDKSRLEHGLQLFRRGPRSHTTWCATDSTNAKPWIYDVARSLGYITFFGDEFCYKDSIYVTQENVFPLNTDYDIRELYCRLGINNKVMGPKEGPDLCIGHEHENPAFDQITGMWNSYHDIPKFAYLNAIAAHSYEPSWIKMISGIERYDAQLVSFLKRMTARADFSNTVIIVRADHGLQSGPAGLEYSTQVEQREPWTEIIVPESLDRLSLEALAANQDRMATGYDLYHTIRAIMSWQNEDLISPPIPSWSYNLFQSIIPENRTCREAKVPDDFCPCDGVGPDRRPQFGVCNAFEPHVDLACVGDDKPLWNRKHPDAEPWYINQ